MKAYTAKQSFADAAQPVLPRRRPLFFIVRRQSVEDPEPRKAGSHYMAVIACCIATYCGELHRS